MDWRPGIIAVQDPESCKLTFYSTNYVGFHPLDRIKKYFKQIQYKPKH